MDRERLGSPMNLAEKLRANKRRRLKRGAGGAADDPTGMIAPAQAQLATQNLRDPATFDPKTYAPTGDAEIPPDAALRRWSLVRQGQNHRADAHMAKGGRAHMAAGGTPMSDADMGIAPAAPAVMSDADMGITAPAAPAAQDAGIASYIPQAISDIPHEAYEATANQIKSVGAAWDAIRARHAAQATKDASPSGSFFDPSAITNQVSDAVDTGRALLSSVPTAPIRGAAESLIPHEAYEATANQIKSVGAAWDAIRARHAAQATKDASPSGSFFDPSAITNQVSDAVDTGRALLSAASVPTAPIQGAAEYLIGHPMAQAEHMVGTVINPAAAAKDNPETMYQNAKGDVDLAMSAARAKKTAPTFSTAPNKNIPVPSTKDLFKAADNNYKNMRGYGVEIHPDAVADVADNILTELHTEGYRDYLAPKTFRAVEELKNPVGQNVEISDIEGVRRALNKAGKDPAERDAVRRAIGGIDDYLANLHPNDVVVNPHYAKQVGQEAGEARANYAAAKRSELLDEMGRKASRQANSAGSGNNIDNATRQRIKSVLDDPKKSRGFSDAEKDQMEKIVAGTKVGNVARLLGKFSPSGVVSGALSAGAGFAAHGPLGAVALPTAGYIAKKIGDASTAAQAAKLSSLVRSRSPLGRQAAINHVATHLYVPASQPAALAAPVAGVAGMRLPSLSMPLGLQGPVPSYADDKQPKP
jgi:hypothetical protein